MELHVNKVGLELFTFHLYYHNQKLRGPDKVKLFNPWEKPQCAK